MFVFPLFNSNYNKNNNLVFVKSLDVLLKVMYNDGKKTVRSTFNSECGYSSNYLKIAIFT